MYSQLVYRIPFSETDAMGIVHHSNHARYFERGRIEMLRQLGLSYAEFTEQGFHFPVTALSTVFCKPIRFDTVLAVETRISSLTKTRLQFSYRAYVVDESTKTMLSQNRLKGPIFAEATTDHCCVNQAGRPVPIPKDTYVMLEKHLVAQERE